MIEREELDPTSEGAAASNASSPSRVGPRERVADRLMHAEVMRDLLGTLEESSDSPGLGARVQRFIVLDRIGAGGMGTVYLAYDPELDRRVALKVVLPTGTAKHDQRLRREALALARLTHPNVVTIHEVGTAGNDLFLAMEYVEGVDLAGWAREHPVGSRKRFATALDILRRAGAGLAAAHRAGLVHRDFKPSNVLVGNDGRVKVADFGLARAPEDTASSPSSGSQTESDDRVVGALTATGAMVGTPRYMAPEQQEGRAVDARTDQFAFCVTAWEVLFGSPAWPGMPDPEEPPTPPRWAPRWLRRVFEKGLAPRPEQRWTSMDDLLLALRRGGVRARVQMIALGLGAAAMVAVGVETYAYRERAAAIAACEEEGARIDAVWNAERSEELRASMLATGLDYAEASAQRVAPWLDDYAQAWTEARTQVCLRTNVERSWDSDLHARATWCLDERSVELDAVLGLLMRGGAPTVRAAVPAASGLPRIEPCLDPATLLPAPPEGTHEALRAVREELIRAHAHWLVGDYEAGLATANEGLTRARETGWTPMIASAGLRVGELLSLVGRVDEAEATLQDAYFQAVEAETPALAMRIAEELAATLGETGHRAAEALLWARHGEAHRKHVPDPTGLLRAGYFYDLGTIHEGSGDYDAAAENYARALAIREDVLGPDHPMVAASLVNAARAEQKHGNYVDAERKAVRALEIFERSVGTVHPYTAQATSQLAGIRYAMGDYAQARALYVKALDTSKRMLSITAPELFEVYYNLSAAEWKLGLDRDAFEHTREALSLAEQAYGPNHPWVALVLTGVASLHYGANELDEARAACERAVDVLEASLGPDHPELAQALALLGVVHLAKGAHAEAQAAIERAIAIRERALGADHVDLSRFLVDLASVHRATGRSAEALAVLDRADASIEREFGPNHPDLAYSLLERSAILLARGDAAAAVAPAERAVAIHEATEIASSDLALARFALARALWAAEGDRSRSTALAHQALDALRSAGAEQAAAVAEVEAWLRTVER